MRFRCATCNAHMGVLSKSYDVRKVLLSCTNPDCPLSHEEWAMADFPDWALHLPLMADLDEEIVRGEEE